MRFVAIDFETANPDPASACAVGLVVVEGSQIVDRVYHLILPRTTCFLYTPIHGLTWAHVRTAPTFAQLWPELERRMVGADFLAAHYAPFDRRVLLSCCRAWQLPAPRLPFVCTVKLARQVWGIHPTRLPNVCARLGIPLVHHRADSDAEACARILIEAAQTGWNP